MSDTLARRRYLARLYADNARIFFTEERLKDHFPCPVCMGAFHVSTVEPETLTADLAHVWPSAAGGNLTTLMCKRCNNRIGGQYDEHISRNYKIANAFKGTGEERINARIRTEHGSMGVSVTRKGTNFDLRE